jgi:CheY-like chemotaxis protein
MVLVIALPDLALRISGLLGGAAYLVHVVDGPELRHRVHSHQPDVILLDYRMGGSSWRAVDEVTAIAERTATRPNVIALLPNTSKEIDREAARRGCYDVVSVASTSFDCEILESVAAANLSRRRRRLHPLSPSSRSSLH